LFGLGMYAQVRFDNYGRQPGLVTDLMMRDVAGHAAVQVAGGRTSVGPVGEASMTRRLESEYDPVAWRASVRWREEPFVYNSLVYGSVVQPLVSAGADVGLVWRTGPVGRQRLLGGAISSERLFADGGVLAA